MFLCSYAEPRVYATTLLKEHLEGLPQDKLAPIYKEKLTIDQQGPIQDLFDLNRTIPWTTSALMV